MAESQGPTKDYLPTQGPAAPRTPRPGFGKDAPTVPPSANQNVLATTPTTAIPGYVLETELGRGGMGVVFKARQVALNRPVALKMILAGDFASPDARARFLAEAEAIAKVHHAHIVQVYEFNTFAGKPYFALEFVAGGTLARRLDHVPQDARWSAGVVEKVARAMQAAHAEGIIHRDLKPANVLLTEEGEPKITDFGLVKHVSSDDEPSSRVSLTASGAVVGTPNYMAPEQARGSKDVGPAADLYALGAILYECLTGRPPFQAASVLETLDLVREADPLAPRRLQPRIPRDLETICLKCLQKDPRRRYPSAAALADDLRCFLEDRTITARPAGLVERGWKWARRYPAWAGLWLAGTVALFGVTWAWQQTELARQALAGAEQAERDQRIEAVAARQEEKRQREHAEAALYFSRIPQAELHWRDNRIAEATALLDQFQTGTGLARLRGWEWHYLQRLCAAHLGSWTSAQAVHGLAFDPRGGRLAFVAGLAPDASGQPATSEPGELGLIQWPAKQLSRLTLRGGALWALAVSSADGAIATVGADGRVRLWPVGAQQPTPALTTSGPASAVAFRPDGAALLVGGPGFLAAVPRPSGGARPLPPAKGSVQSLAFDRDGDAFVAGTTEQVTLRDGQSGQERQAWPHPARSVAISPDGRTVAAASSDGRVPVWDAAIGAERFRLRGHRGAVNAVAISADGRWLATGGADRTVRLWDLATGAPRATYRGHTWGVLAVAFGPGGELASAGQDGKVLLWDVSRHQEYCTLPTAPAANALGFDPDGRLVIVRAGKVTRRDLAGGSAEEWPLALADTGSGEFCATALRADGRQVVGPSAPDPKVVRVWSLPQGLEVAAFAGHTQPVVATAVSGDGQTVVSAAWDPARPREPCEVRGWQVDRDPERYRLTLPGVVFALALSPDGRRCAAACADGGVHLWDAATGLNAETWFLDARQVAKIVRVAFSPDGRYLAAVSYLGQGGLWELATGRLVPFQGAPGLGALAFSPDGRRLAGSARNLVQVWDAATGQEFLTLRPLDGEGERELPFLPHVAFSPDGKDLLAFFGHLGQILIWDTH